MMHIKQASKQGKGWVRLAGQGRAGQGEKGSGCALVYCLLVCWLLLDFLALLSFGSKRSGHAFFTYSI